MNDMNTENLLKGISSGLLNPTYPSLYGSLYDEHDMDARFASLVGRHQALFGEQEILRLYSTPGRTELGGNHTDHNHGHVLAASINLDTIAAVSPTDDMVAVLDSEGFDPVSIDLKDLSIHPEEEGTTHALLRGIASRFAAKGCSLRGFRAATSTRVLKGSGLSSSAAVEVLIGTIFNDLYAENSCSTTELAIFGKYAENTYFMKPSGLMDQIACANGGIVGIDFADTAAPVIDPVAYDFTSRGYTLAVVDTGGNHANLTPEYAAIPTEMRAVAKELGKSTCHEITFDELLDHMGTLRSRLGDRAVIRACHFLSEDERAVKMAGLLHADDITGYIAMVRESGRSSGMYLQNLYPTSLPQEQGVTLALALTDGFLSGEGACRVHGGGFAGTIQAYIPNERFKEYTIRMESVFGDGSVTPLAVRNVPTGRIS